MALLSGDMHRLLSGDRARDHAAMVFGLVDEGGRDKGGQFVNVATALATLAEKVATDQRGVVATLAVVLAGYEGSLSRSSWRSVTASTQRYLEFLAGQGYELSAVEHRACGHEVADGSEVEESEPASSSSEPTTVAIGGEVAS